MNYLGHACLSFGDPEILTGNLIADHVKGRLALEQFPAGIKEGILIHRRIDEFTDIHPAVQRAKIWFREDYGLYAGAVLDTLFDHFIANDPVLFPSETALKAFTEDTYQKVATQEKYFPQQFANYFPHMRTHNWLLGYRNLQGVRRSLDGLNRRAKHMPDPEKAYNIFIGNYYQLGQCCSELLNDAIPFVKSLRMS